MFFSVGIISAQITNAKEDSSNNTKYNTYKHGVIDKKAEYLNGGINGFRKELMLKMNLDNIDVYAGIPKEILTAYSKILPKQNNPKYKPSPKEQKIIQQVEKSMSLSTIIEFVVDKDGNISNIKTYGQNPSLNKEAINSMKKIEGKWNPAELNGKKIKSMYRIPIKVRFE